MKTTKPLVHASDCAMHSEPAYPAGPCDCGASLVAATRGGRKSLWLAAAVMGLAALCAVAIAQVTLPQVATVDAGSDRIQVIPRGQPSAPSYFASPAQISGPVGLQYTVPLTAFSLTFNNGTTYYVINPAGTLATGTFTFDANASGGQKACVESTQTQTAVTIAAGTGQTIGGTPVTAMVAYTTYCWIYVRSTAVWYPITI